MKRILLALAALIALPSCGFQYEPTIAYTRPDGTTMTASLVIRAIEIDTRSGK